jgi:hypothetical protein
LLCALFREITSGRGDVPGVVGRFSASPFLFRNRVSTPNMQFESVLPSEVQYPNIQSLAECKRTTLTLNSESGNVFSAPGSVIRFTVPSFSGGFADFSAASIVGRITWTGPNVAGRPYALLGNGYSLFDNLITSVAGSQIENLQHPSLSLQTNHEIFSSTAEL